MFICWSKFAERCLVGRDNIGADLGDDEGEKSDVIRFLAEVDLCRFKFTLFTELERWWTVCGEFDVGVRFILDIECSRSICEAGMVGGVVFTELGAGRT